MEFLIFIAIVLTIYIGVNFYIFIRGNQALPDIPWIKISYYILFGIAFSAYIIHIILVRSNPSDVCRIFTWIGSFWLGAMVYFLLLVIFWDILRLINHFIPFFPAFVKAGYSQVKIYILGLSILLTAIILIYGYYNASNPRISEIDITVNKSDTTLEKLTIVAVSDIHIGTIIARKQVTKLVESINKLNPDIVLFPGDILDEALEPVLKYKSGDPLKNIKSKYGVYAITGNHEYIGGIQSSVNYLKTLNITLLRDTTVLIDNSFYIVGREDRDSKRFANIIRKPLKKLMENIDKSKPIFLMDHQPFRLEEAEKNGVDLQISGHTHHGQLWPFNYITEKVYELSWGYKKKGATHYYVSSGYGTWGPPVRIGNTPEIVLFNINFK